MIVLGFDTATPATAVALRLADGTTLQAYDDPAAGERPGHVTRLLPLARELLAQAGLGWEQVQRVAVGLGPGTFTGLRIGVATARALAQSLAAELVGVSTLQALAEAAFAEGRGAGEQGGREQRGRAADAGAEGPRRFDAVLAVIDARRGEAFAAAYAPGRKLLAPRALEPEGLAGLLAGSSSWLAVGDGALRFRDQLQAAGATVPEDSSPLHRVSGKSICDLAVRGQAVAPEAIVPDYRRRPDAEIALESAAR